ncbi:MAG: riboflavin synthase subunit beta [Flavobacteriaceae bacterium]
MGIFKRKQNKRFGYEPRYYKSDKEGSPFEIENKFDKYRRSTGNVPGLIGKFVNVWYDFRNPSDSKTNKTILIIVAIFILIFLFIIDFDLSIFMKPL